VGHRLLDHIDSHRSPGPGQAEPPGRSIPGPSSLTTRQPAVRLIKLTLDQREAGAGQPDPVVVGLEPARDVERLLQALARDRVTLHLVVPEQLAGDVGLWGDPGEVDAPSLIEPSLESEELHQLPAGVVVVHTACAQARPEERFRFAQPTALDAEACTVI